MNSAKSRKSPAVLHLTDTKPQSHWIGLLLLWGLILFALWDADLLAKTVSESLTYCVTRIIPVLFPIAAAGGLLTCFAAPPRLICRPVGRLFRLSDASVGVLMIALVSGFPIGAMLSSRLLESGRISKEEASRLASYTNNASAAFLTSGVGVGIFGEYRIGWILWIASTLSALAVGVLMGRRVPPPSVREIADDIADAPPTLAKLAESLKVTGLGMMNLTVFVVFFAVFCKFGNDLLCILLPSGTGADLVQALMTAFLEITGGLAVIGKLSYSLPIRIGLAGAAAGWGGLSVFMQCMAAGRAVQGRRLWKARLSIAVLSGILAMMLGFIG